MLSGRHYSRALRPRRRRAPERAHGPGPHAREGRESLAVPPFPRFPAYPTRTRLASKARCPRNARPDKLGRRSARALCHKNGLALHGGVLRGTRLALGRFPAEHGVPAAAAPGGEELRAGAALGLVDRARRAAELAEAARVLVRRHLVVGFCAQRGHPRKRSASDRAEGVLGMGRKRPGARRNPVLPRKRLPRKKAGLRIAVYNAL